MTFTLSPETEAQLTAVAALRGLPPEDVLNELIAEENRRQATVQAEFNNAVSDVRASLEDFAAGRSVSLEDYRAQAVVRRQERDASDAGREAA